MEPNRISETPLIWFGKKIQSVENRINNPDNKILGIEKTSSITDIIESIVNDFSTFELKTIVKSPTSSLLKISEYLKANIPKKVLQSIAISWPPRIQMPTLNLQEMFFILAKITSECEDPTKFLKWSIQCLLPDIFSQNTSLKNPEIRAISLCKKLDDQNNEYWAILNGQNEFTLHKIEGDTTKKVCRITAQAIIKDHTNNSVSIITPNSDVISFIPQNEAQSEMWCEAMTPEESPYPMYLTSLKTPFPEQLISSIQYGIVQSDGLILRSLIQSNATKGVDRNKLFESLLDIFIDAGKVSVFYANVIISDIETSQNPLAFIYSPNSSTSALLDVLNNRYIHTYFEEFVSKLLYYIDSKGSLDLLSNNVKNEEGETTFFTSMKYICASYSFVPDRIRHFLSILKHYIGIVQNNRYYCVDFLCSLFFEKILNPLMANPTLIIKDFTLKNPKSIAEMRTLIGSAFHHKALYYINQELGKWDDRLRFKMFPTMDAFIFGVTECQKVPSYDGISIHVLNNASANILSVISQNNQEYLQNFASLTNQNSHGTCLSWNFAVGLTLLFAHSSDADELVNHANNVHNDYLNYIENLRLQNPKPKDSPLVRGVDVLPTTLKNPFEAFDQPPEVTKDNILPDLPPIPKYNAKVKVWKFQPPVPKIPDPVDEAPVLPLIVTSPIKDKKNSDKKPGKAKTQVKSKKLSDVEILSPKNSVPSPAEMIKSGLVDMGNGGTKKAKLQKHSSVSNLELIQIPLDLYDLVQNKGKGKKQKPVRHSSSADAFNIKNPVKIEKPKDSPKSTKADKGKDKPKEAPVKSKNNKEKPNDKPKVAKSESAATPKSKKKAQDDSAAIVKKPKVVKNDKPNTIGGEPIKRRKSDAPKKPKGKK